MNKKIFLLLFFKLLKSLLVNIDDVISLEDVIQGNKYFISISYFFTFSILNILNLKIQKELYKQFFHLNLIDKLILIKTEYKYL